MSTPEIHPTSRSWVLPPEGRPQLPAPLQRTNLRVLGGREGRFEHHLQVVGRVGEAQLEIPIASEPLFFAHANVSDEYVIALPTGDPLVDGFPLRVFLADPDTGEHVARINHRVGELLVHPYGYLHWPGKLRPPYAVPKPPPGMRRCSLALVCCASELAPPPADRRLWVGEGMDGRAKVYGEAEVPILLTDLAREEAGTVARVGRARWQLLVEPREVAPPRGGYLVVLRATASGPAFDTDLVYIPPGARYLSEAEGVERALLLSSDEVDASPPPAWTEAPEPPFAPMERNTPASLPVDIEGLRVEAVDEDFVEVEIGESRADVPRYWLARLLFRLGLHGFRLGYVETYGGFYSDDRGGTTRLGLRGGGSVSLAEDRVQAQIEALYRAVAPPGHVEDLRE